MNIKSILKIAIISLFIIFIAYIIIFSKYLICETWSIKQNGNTYYLTQSLHHYKLSKMSNDIIPKELSIETIKGEDYINNLMKNATNITTSYWVFLVIQIIIIIALIIKLKNIN